MTILSQDNIRTAIDTLESAIGDYKSFPPGTLDGMIVSSEIAIACMKMQIASKPKAIEGFKGWWQCPRCNSPLFGKHLYCILCHQKIDWEEDE